MKINFQNEPTYSLKFIQLPITFRIFALKSDVKIWPSVFYSFYYVTKSNILCEDSNIHKVGMFTIYMNRNKNYFTITNSVKTMCFP